MNVVNPPSGTGMNNATTRTGTAGGTGNGVTTAFVIPHGLGSVPSFANAVAANPLTAGAMSVTADATNITVNFLLAPTAGALSFKWIVIA